MTVLSSKQILHDNNTLDPNAITTLTLNQKALSDVSCLSEFKNLERLDLGFNNLSSLEGLKLCVNLKWLSVVQNKLQSLKGIEGLTKLTVLNAGKNKLRSMDEVRSLLSLRALILNDNEIVSVCRLDQVRELNTLVLSRNPIREVGDLLVKVKSITKLSLSNCQLQTIDSSMKSCIELKELRLAHNEIKTLPGELARNTKVQNLDLGNNLITNWSDLKVLSTLVNLKNLNLQGNPIAENVKLAKKIRKLVPNLQIFNARPVDKTMKNEKGGGVDRVDDIALNVGNKLVGQKELKLKKQKRNDLSEQKASDWTENSAIIGKKVKKKLNVVQENENNTNGETPYVDPDVQQKLKRKKQKTTVYSKERASDHKGNSTISEKELNRKSKKVKPNEGSSIDDKETPLMDLFVVDTVENSNERDIDHKIKSRVMGAPLQLLSPASEVGLGGPSTWDDE